MLYNINDYNPDLFYEPEVEPTKLWKLPCGCFFQIAGEEPVYYFSKIDGAYSICYGVTEEVKHAGVYFFAVWTPCIRLLEKTDEPNKEA